jgi:NDP-sugar pyrophosphorylase family protein
MKAMILAAGLGTRLLPFTDDLPKPLFPFMGTPLLDRMIRTLQDAGCEGIIINTHHLHEKIDAFIAGQDYSIPVLTRYEPVILGTGGGIKNAADFWDDRPFIVINSDIVTNIDLRSVYNFHLRHPHPVTLVLHDDEEFNSVCLNKDGFITGFSKLCVVSCESSGSQHPTPNTQPATRDPQLTFTGIQVLDPEVLDFMPSGVFSSSIDAYKKLVSAGKQIKGFISEGYYWKDMGTPERYKQALMDKMAEEAFRQKSPELENSQFSIVNCQLSGDGSDRKWHRLRRGSQSFVVADHGIKKGNAVSETDAFVKIGQHLYNKGIPVPKIWLYDIFSGLVFLEDLGDVNLQAAVRHAKNLDEILSHYRAVIDILVRMSVLGAQDFDLSWTCQTEYYDRKLILEKECRYFTDAFLKGYLGISDVCFEDFEDEFLRLADKALESSVTGFMHRDMQSRNIMAVSDSGSRSKFYLIDFQGGRMGPMQYDLASLLIDPYVNLPLSAREELVAYCIEKLSAYVRVNPPAFRQCYSYCSLTRNLQMLGAFGYLTRVKGKTYFEKYIPAGLKTLKDNLSNTEFSGLSALIGQTTKAITNGDL